MRILIFIVLIGVTACNMPDNNNSQLKNNDTTAALIPVQTNSSRFVLDTTVISNFAVDTADQISKTLNLISDFDKASANFHRDTFSVDEKTSEGCEIIVAKDKSTGYIKFYGTLFGEMGKSEFSFYALNSRYPKPTCAIFKDISYDKPMYEQDIKIRETNTTYEIYTDNKIIAILDGQKRKQNLSAQTLQKKEAVARQFFKDYIGQITIAE